MPLGRLRAAREVGVHLALPLLLQLLAASGRLCFVLRPRHFLLTALRARAPRRHLAAARAPGVRAARVVPVAQSQRLVEPAELRPMLAYLDAARNHPRRGPSDTNVEVRTHRLHLG